MTDILWRRNKGERAAVHDGRGRAGRWLTAIGRDQLSDSNQITHLTWDQEGIIQAALLSNEMRGDLYTRVFIGEHRTPWSALAA